MTAQAAPAAQQGSYRAAKSAAFRTARCASRRSRAPWRPGPVHPTPAPPLGCDPTHRTTLDGTRRPEDTDAPIYPTPVGGNPAGRRGAPVGSGGLRSIPRRGGAAHAATTPSKHSYTQLSSADIRPSGWATRHSGGTPHRIVGGRDGVMPTVTISIQPMAHAMMGMKPDGHTGRRDLMFLKHETARP